MTSNMTCGDLKKAQGATPGDLESDKIIASARLAFGHIEGRSDLDVVCLRVSQLDRLLREARSELQRLRGY